MKEDLELHKAATDWAETQTHDDAYSFRAGADWERKRDRWIKISDRKPEPNELVLWALKGGNYFEGYFFEASLIKGAIEWWAETLTGMPVPAEKLVGWQPRLEPPK